VDRAIVGGSRYHTLEQRYGEDHAQLGKTASGHGGSSDGTGGQFTVEEECPRCSQTY